MNPKATRSDWQNHDFSKPKLTKFTCHFTSEQFNKIIQGIIPEEMEDKWFIFFEYDWLYCHRSWSGFLNYKLKITREEQEQDYSIKEFWLERDTEKYSCIDDKKDIQIALMLIFTGLLGQDYREIFASENIHSDDDVLKTWSTFRRMFFK